MSKKRKISVANVVETSSDEPNTKQIELKSPEKLNSPKPNSINQSPIKDVAEMKKKRNKLISESSEFTEKSESEGSSKSHKKKKEKKYKSEIAPPVKPPSTFLKYFTSNIHTGKPNKAKKALKRMAKKERKELEAEYSDKVQSYIVHLKKYLETLSKEDAAAYVSRDDCVLVQFV